MLEHLLRKAEAHNLLYVRAYLDQDSHTLVLTGWDADFEDEYPFLYFVNEDGTFMYHYHGIGYIAEAKVIELSWETMRLAGVLIPQLTWDLFSDLALAVTFPLPDNMVESDWPVRMVWTSDTVGVLGIVDKGKFYGKLQGKRDDYGSVVFYFEGHHSTTFMSTQSFDNYCAKHGIEVIFS